MWVPPDFPETLHAAQKLRKRKMALRRENRAAIVRAWTVEQSSRT
jgi:hypothetical protein